MTETYFISTITKIHGNSHRRTSSQLELVTLLQLPALQRQCGVRQALRNPEQWVLLMLAGSSPGREEALVFFFFFSLPDV